MTDMECPKCGRQGSVPKEKLNSRLVCKKCLTIFHLTPTGRVVLGEPPDHKYAGGQEHHHAAVATAAQTKKASTSVADLFSDANSTRTAVLGGLLALGLLVLGGYYMLGDSGENALRVKSRRVANALAGNDLTSIKKLATPDSLDDVGKWFDTYYPVLDEMKRASATNELRITVMASENPMSKTGEGDAFFTPARGNERAENLATESGTKGSARTSLGLPLYWILDDGGSWRLDGKRTLTSAPALR